MAITASNSIKVKPVAPVLHDAGGFLEKCDRFMAFEKYAGSTTIQKINYNYYPLLSSGKEDSGLDGPKADLRRICDN